MRGEDVADFTSKAIKASFVKLLNEKPMNKISVKDIVEDCGINRNSFYYHFQSIPALLEELIEEKTAEIIQAHPTIHSLDECFQAVFAFALENKRAAFHIFHSVSRDSFERELMKQCDYAVTAYVQTALGERRVRQEDREVLIRFIKCACFGLIIEWLSSGMKDEAIQELLRVTELCRGLSDELVRRCQAESIKE